MAENPDMKKKLLAEMLPVVEKVKNNLINGLDYDTLMEWSYF